MMHEDFKRDFEFSIGERQTFDISLLNKAIPNAVSTIKASKEYDKIGIDYITKLDNGAEIYVDAKARRKGAKSGFVDGKPVLAIEIWSVMPSNGKKGKVGWTFNTSAKTDMVLYTFDKEDCDKFFLIPFQHLRMAAKRHRREWMKKYGTTVQLNPRNCPRYASECMFVPCTEVIEAVSDEMCISMNG